MSNADPNITIFSPQPYIVRQSITDEGVSAPKLSDVSHSSCIVHQDPNMNIMIVVTERLDA